jgi:hypothetical protein
MRIPPEDKASFDCKGKKKAIDEIYSPSTSAIQARGGDLRSGIFDLRFAICDLAELLPGSRCLWITRLRHVGPIPNPKSQIQNPKSETGMLIAPLSNHAEIHTPKHG